MEMIFRFAPRDVDKSIWGDGFQMRIKLNPRMASLKKTLRPIRFRKEMRPESFSAVTRWQ